MKKLNVLGFAVVAMLLSANAWAGFAQTFVSGTGINTNTSCSVGAPCASIQVALNLTNPGGQVIVEGSGVFAGGFTISKSVTIEAAPGVAAVITGGISASGTLTLIFRGLEFEDGANGLAINDAPGFMLYVENCVFNGFSGNGIYLTGGGELFVKNTVIRNTTNDGIYVGEGVASLDRVTLEGNGGDGLEVNNGTVSITNSVASGNASDGIIADAGSSFTAEVNVESCLVANNLGSGIVSNGGGTNTVRVSNSTVTDNATYGLFASSPAVLQSRVNNTVEGNGTNTLGTTTYTAM
jgi:parallel beta helix pectate lyase-like protein